jgi:hypothetical protein
MGASEEVGNRFECAGDSFGCILYADSNNGFCLGNPESNTRGVVVSNACNCIEEKDVPIGGKHEWAGVVESVNCGLEVVASNFLVLKRGMSVSIEVTSIP